MRGFSTTSGGEAGAVGVLATLITLALAAGAQAGTYVINDCPAAQAGDYIVGPWNQFGSLTPPGSFKQTCATPSDTFGIASNGIPSDATAGDDLQTPPSITMHHIKLWWEAPSPVSGGGWSYALVDVYSPSWSRVFQSTTPMSADGAGKTAPTELSLPTNTSKLNVEIYCTISENCTYNENPLQISGSELTLEDTGLPTAAVTGGGLAGAGSVAGIQSLAYGAEDSGSGVRMVELLVDGQSVANKDYLAECPYVNYAACPTSVSSLISWSTAGASNGTHEVALRIVNAAGNAITVDDHTVTIENGASTKVGPGSPAEIRGPANGTNGSDQAKLTARWIGRSRTTRTSRYGSVDRLMGNLGTTAGKPISGAVLQAYETPAYEGARTVPLARTSTGPTGNWSLSLPRDSSSSALRFEYRSHESDTVPVATAALTLCVHAGLGLHIAPRTASIGREIFFSGVLHGEPIPPGGKQLVLEASSGGSWVQFDTISTDAKGRFHASYRFKFLGPVRYEFRVRSPDEADFPFLDGTSRSVVVDEH